MTAVWPIAALAVTGCIVAAIAMTALWLRPFRSTHTTVLDAAWTASIAGLAVLYALLARDGMPGRRLAIASMMGSWGARLTVHLLFENLPERRGDPVGASFWSF